MKGQLCSTCPIFLFQFISIRSDNKHTRPSRAVVGTLSSLQITGGLVCIILQIVSCILPDANHPTFTGFWSGSLMLTAAIIRIVHRRFPSCNVIPIVLLADGAIILQSVVTTVLNTFACYIFQNMICVDLFIQVNKLSFSIGVICFVEAVVALFGLLQTLLILTHAI